MSKLLQLRGGTTTEHASFTGAVREVTVDTTKDTLVIHDGSTAGGFPLPRTDAEIRTAVEAATDSNVFTDADHSKLNAIEASATADQTDAEIRAAVEAATDSNVFTDADHTKLNAIEASADVTDATNVTAAGALMDSEVTNLAQVKAFSAADYATAAQGTLAANALPKGGGAMTGAITTNSTFDGRDVATDGAKLDGIEASADVTDATNVTAAGALMDSELTNLTAVKAISATPKQIGKETMWVPASAMTPTTSNPCSDLESFETTSGRPDMVALPFPVGADSFAQFSVAFPKSWNLGTVTYQVFWAGIAATTDCAWSIEGVAIANNATIDVAYGTAVVITDAAQGAVEELNVSAESGAVTIAGSPADDGLCYFRFGRDVSAGDMAGDAKLLGIKVFYTTDAANDA